MGRVIALGLQTVLHLWNSCCADPKMAKSIGQWEPGRDELMQDSHDASSTMESEAANDTPGTTKGLRDK